MGREVRATGGVEVPFEITAQETRHIGAAARSGMDRILLPEQPGERVAQGGPPAVDSGLRGARADAQHARHLAERQPLHIPEKDRIPLRRRERGEPRSKRGLDLASEEFPLRVENALREADRRPVPVRGPAGRTFQRHDRPPEAAALADASVPGDGVRPRREGRVAPKRRKRADQGGQHLLHHVLGVLRIPAEVTAEAVYRSGHAVQKSAKGAPIPRPRRLQERPFLLPGHPLLRGGPGGELPPAG
jgi:hypothetical protein